MKRAPLMILLVKVKFFGIQKFFPLQVPVPCMVFVSDNTLKMELFFPLSQNTYQVNLNIRKYTIVGQSMPHRGRWLVLANPPLGHLILYDGIHTICLPKLQWDDMEYDLRDCELMASFIGEPEKGGCVESFLYIPTSDKWELGRTYDDLTHDDGRDILIQPVAQVTTLSHFLWVDIKLGSMFFWENHWNDIDEEMHIAYLGQPIRSAQAVSSIIQDDEFHSFAIFSEGIIRLYALDVRLSAETEIYNLIPITSLQPGQSIVASPFFSGLLFSSDLDQGQRFYFDLLGDHCLSVNVDGATDQEYEVLRKCSCPAPDGGCHCLARIFLLEEQSIVDFLAG